MLEGKCKVAVFVSGGGTNLQAILDSRGKIIKNADICLVASNNKDAYALERAKKHDIETFIIEDEQRLVEKLKSLEIDFIVLAGYLRILSEDFCKLYSNRIINVHPSLIPSFCGKGFYGLKVHEKALEYGVKVSGATVHFVNEIPDGGKIIDQRAVRVHEGDTAEDLQKRVMAEAEHIILPQAVENVALMIKNGEL
ncbi:phosphoribosylglycinamide formyltransferase [Eubacterium infirmum F0142]|nr:phosphoribosylglycinamide formyltransferase [Eubacterium infirmum F0142]